MNRKNNCRHGMFEVFPSQFRLGHLPPGVSEQVFDRETSDIAQLKGLQTISVGICTADKLASLGGHLLSQPLPATHLLLCNNSPYFIFVSLLSVFYAFGIKASHTCYISFRDIQAPSVSEASSAEDVTAK
jgi:hypothetical protein